MNEKQLMDLEQQNGGPLLKLNASTLRELRLLYKSGAVTGSQIQQMLGLRSQNRPEPAELPMPADEAEKFLSDLKIKLEETFDHRA